MTFLAIIGVILSLCVAVGMFYDLVTFKRWYEKLEYQPAGHVILILSALLIAYYFYKCI